MSQAASPVTASPVEPRVRVAEVFSGFGLGGAERSIAARQARSGGRLQTVHVNIGPTDGPMRPVIAANVPIVDLGQFDVRGLRRVMAQRQIQVVVAHTPRAVVMAVLAARTMRVRPAVVSVAHLSELSDRRWKAVLLALPMRLANRRVDRVLAVSALAASGPWCAGAPRVEVNWLGSELIGDDGELDLMKYWPSSARLRWLALTRLVPVKNLSNLLEAVADSADLLRAAGAHLAIVGDGPLDRPLRHLVEEWKISDLVGVHRAVMSPGPLLRAADAMLISSTVEGAPLAVFEALIAGMRLVSTPLGILPELDAIGFSNAQDDGLIALDGFERDDIVAGLEQLVALGPCDAREREERAERCRELHVDQTTGRFIDRLVEVAAK